MGWCVNTKISCSRPQAGTSGLCKCLVIYDLVHHEGCCSASWLHVCDKLCLLVFLKWHRKGEIRNGEKEVLPERRKGNCCLYLLFLDLNLFLLSFPELLALPQMFYGSGYTVNPSAACSPFAGQKFDLDVVSSVVAFVTCATYIRNHHQHHCHDAGIFFCEFDSFRQYIFVCTIHFVMTYMCGLI